MQIHTPTVVQKGGGGWCSPPPWVFDMVQYLEMILPSVESLWSSLQDEEYCMGGALLEASDVTKHGRQDFEIRLKQWELINVCA